MLGVIIAVMLRLMVKAFIIHCNKFWFLMLWNLNLFMVLDVVQPWFVSFWFLMLYRTFVCGLRGVTMPDVIVIYLSFNSGDLASTSSQICGSWNLPIFLLRDGSLTLIKIASLMFLAMLLSSLPTMLKLPRDTS